MRVPSPRTVVSKACGNKDIADRLIFFPPVQSHTSLISTANPQDCPPFTIIALVQRLRPTISVPGEYLVAQDEVGSEMYLLTKGQVRGWI